MYPIKLINIEGLILTISFTVSEYIIYLKVSKTLETWLHSYYTENKKYLRYRMLLNVWYFSIFSMLFIVNISTPSSVSLMVTFDITPPYKDAANIVYIFGILLTDIPSVIYAWINAKHIKFREWIIVVMEGHRIIKRFNGCSIFIKNLKTHKEENQHTDTSNDIDELLNSESFSADFPKDYDEDSGYQRAYKQKFVLNNIKNK